MFFTIDLQNLEKWATNWGMRFNAKKCYILSLKENTRFIQTRWPDTRTDTIQPLLRSTNTRRS